MKRRVRAGEHRSLRQSAPISLLAECEAEALSWPRRSARLTARQCEAERVVIGVDEQIVFTRTLPAAIPAIYAPEDWARLTAGHTLHELGPNTRSRSSPGTGSRWLWRGNPFTGDF